MSETTSKRILWGGWDDSSSFTPPITILREQAKLLGEITHNVLQGIVTTVHSQDYFKHTLKIAAPALQDYIVDVLEVKHKLALFPLEIVNSLNGRQYTCGSEEEFFVAIEQILKSDRVAKAIAVLVAQCKES